MGTDRIRPNDGYPTHFDAVSWLNEVIIQWTLRKAGEPHTLTLELIGQWRQHRQQIANCRSVALSVSQLDRFGRDSLLGKEYSGHNYVIETISEVVLNLEAEYGWPAPLQPLVNQHDIDRLRECSKELEQCLEYIAETIRKQGVTIAKLQNRNDALNTEIEQLKKLLKTCRSYMHQVQMRTRAWPAEKLMNLYHEISKATWDDENEGET